MSRLIFPACLAVAVGSFGPAAPPPADAPDPLAAGRKFADAGQLDRFVASSETWDLPADDPRLWRPLFPLAKELAENRQPRLEWPPGDFLRDFKGYLTCHPGFVRTAGPHRQRDRDLAGNPIAPPPEAVIAPELFCPTGMTYTLAVIRGPVVVKVSIGESLVLATGDVTAGGCMSAVVVADGDVDIGGPVSHCVIVARGNIRVREGALRCALVAGGTVTIDKPVVAEEFVLPVVRENERKPLGWLTWYELADAGAEADTADGGVLVKAVAAGKPFAAAGVKAGDVVTKVGEHAVATPEGLRRRLRDAHATAAEATLAVRRDGQAVTVRVPLPH